MIKKDDMNKIVIFDLDGTLALIDKRRDLATKDDGKIKHIPLEYGCKIKDYL